MYYGRLRGAAIKFEGPRRTPKWWYGTFMRIISMVSFWTLSGRKVTVPRLFPSAPLAKTCLVNLAGHRLSRVALPRERQANVWRTSGKRLAQAGACEEERTACLRWGSNPRPSRTARYDPGPYALYYVLSVCDQTMCELWIYCR